MLFVDGVKGLLFEDEILKVQEQVNLLINQGIKTIIALGHAGFSKDRQVAREVVGIDLVIGGHSNTFLYNGKTVAFDRGASGELFSWQL